MNQQPATIRTYLFRGVFLLSLLGVIVIPLALGQEDAGKRSVTKPNAVAKMSQLPPLSRQAARAQAVRASELPTITSGAAGAHLLRILPMPKAPQVVLYDQYDNASTAASLSSTFTDFPTFGADLADDFVVPGGETWSVDSIDADGVFFNGPGPANDWNVFIYADNGGLPGTLVYSSLNQPVSVNGTTFTVNLSPAACLAEGHYWIEIQANMTFVPNGEWGWTDRTVQSNSPAAWQNPGGGFGLCPSWTSKLTCIPTAGGPDQVFRINGTTGSCGGTPTPTLTPTPTPTCTPGGTPGPWTQAAPVGIDHYGGFMDSDGTYAYEGGGYSFSIGDNITQFGRFDPVANTWTPLAAVPDLNNGEASAVYAPNVNKLFVFGGEEISSATVVNTTRIYDIAHQHLEHRSADAGCASLYGFWLLQRQDLPGGWIYYR